MSGAKPSGHDLFYLKNVNQLYLWNWKPGKNCPNLGSFFFFSWKLKSQPRFIRMVCDLPAECPRLAGNWIVGNNVDSAEVSLSFLSTNPSYVAFVPKVNWDLHQIFPCSLIPTNGAAQQWIWGCSAVISFGIGMIGNWSLPWISTSKSPRLPKW